MQMEHIKIQLTNITRNRKSFIGAEYDKNETYTIESFEQWFKVSKENRPYDSIVLLLEMDTYRKSYDIKYVSVDDLLSIYGGTSTVLFYIAEMILDLFIAPYFTSSVINEVFQFHENDMDQSEIKDFMASYKKVYNNRTDKNDGGGRNEDLDQLDVDNSNFK